MANQMPFDMDLARAPGRARLTARKKGSGCENGTLRNFWEIESTGTDKICAKFMTEDGKLALGKVESSLQTVDERYQVGVPWRSDRPKLTNNRQMAQSRLVSTERNLRKNPIVANEYQKTIEAYVQKYAWHKMLRNRPSCRS